MKEIPNGILFGTEGSTESFNKLTATSDNLFNTDMAEVDNVFSTDDKKVEFVHINNSFLAHIPSSMGYPAYYPLLPAKIEKPVKAVLIDLDGTSVKSEDFWIWIIQTTIATLLDNDKFQLQQEDMPFVSGHSVSEHLQYCINKYCPDKKLEDARNIYFRHTNFQMNEVLEGRGKADAFKPREGLKDFLYELKSMDIKIGLVTSGLYEKAWPEILSAFRTLDMGDPKEFYDAIITAGFALRKGEPGTLGELSPKPHPWLYAEVAKVGLGISADDRHHVIGIEDSGAGICSVRLAGFSAIGLDDGNIIESGTRALCNDHCSNFEQILKIIK